MKTLGEIIKNRRLELGLSQIELSKIAEIDCKTISFIERNIRKKPIPDTLYSLAAALDLDICALFYASGYTEDELRDMFANEEEYGIEYVLTIKGYITQSGNDENEAKKNALNYIAENLISASEYDDDLGYILRDSDVNIKVDLEDWYYEL